MTDREAKRRMKEARRKEAEQNNRLQEEEHSVPRGSRLRDALDPDDTGQPNRVHTGGYLKDGTEMTDQEIEELGLQPHRMERTATRRDDAS